MKTLLCALSLLVPSLASAATLTWDRNTETDMASYSVYACFIPGCTPALGAGMHQGITLQPSVGVKPTFTLDIAGKEGVVSVTAKDKSGNESGLSVPLGFDKQAPGVPANPTLQ